MRIFRTKSEIQSYLLNHRQGKKVGLIPTLGALHQGHLSMVYRSQKENDITICYIFLNPTQFNNKEDYDSYPRTEKRDFELLKETRIEAVFAPPIEEVYSAGLDEKFNYHSGLFDILEGKFRPGHFKGVVQVLDKFFAIVDPDRVYFGEKDFQQLSIVKEFANKHYPNIQICPCPIIREASGLAMSSRNSRLDPKKIQSSVTIYKVLNLAKKDYLKDKTIKDIITESKRTLEGNDLEVEYLEFRNESDFSQNLKRKDGVRVLVAVWAGKVRLIDNLKVW